VPGPTKSSYRHEAFDPSENDLSCRESICSTAATCRACPCCSGKDNFGFFPRSPDPCLPKSPTCRSVIASATLHQWWGHTEPLDAVQNCCEQIARYGHLGQLGRHVPGVPDDPRTDLDQLLPQRRQRPVLNATRQRQPPEVCVLKANRRDRGRGGDSGPRTGESIPAGRRWRGPLSCVAKLVAARACIRIWPPNTGNVLQRLSETMDMNHRLSTTGLRWQPTALHRGPALRCDLTTVV
jgi:hypothetical protein